MSEAKETMCGIAAIFSGNQEEEAQIVTMIDRIVHRGPNDSGIERLCNGRAWLGHRRLSILDVSSAGKQPMSYGDGKLWMTYNGEIYNYLEIREELIKKGYSFSTNTDSEVLLASYDCWGRKCVEHLNGMFAFVIVDLRRSIYFAARDRFGVKPLYYWISPDKERIALASEIKEFMSLKGWHAAVNGQRAYDFLRYGLTDDTEETLFEGVFQVSGGYAMTGSLDNPVQKRETYQWYKFTVEKSHLSWKEASEQFRELFESSCRLRLRSDVGVGSCLSGGLDSSSIVCMVNDILRGEGREDSQRTVSAIAPKTIVDESAYIQEVLSQRGLNGYFTAPSPEDLFLIEKEITWHQDEPFSSTSIFAQWCVFQEASRRKLTVMLDGQGADELLAGYHRFFAPLFVAYFRKGRLQKLISEAKSCKEFHGYPYSFVARGILKTFFPENLVDFGRRMYRQEAVRDTWFSADALHAKEIPPVYYRRENRAKTVEDLSLQLLQHTNLPMLLRYEDRNSMAHSIESRLPFLDYRLAEFILSLPDEYKIRDGWTKAVMREAMTGILPEKIRTRMDKIGFETPEEVWLKKNRDSFRKRIAFAVEATNGIITESAVRHLDEVIHKNKRDFSVWRMVNFGIWYDLFINKQGRA